MKVLNKRLTLAKSWNLLIKILQPIITRCKLASKSISSLSSYKKIKKTIPSHKLSEALTTSVWGLLFNLEYLH
jgi:hypothetical protein